MHEVSLRFYGELNDLLRRRNAGTPYTVAFPEPRSVKDLIESEGVPHTEVGLILINGEPSDFAAIVSSGLRISVFPPFTSLDISECSALVRSPFPSPRFVADVHLGKLAKRLRLLGADCLFNPGWHDDDLADLSESESRILLTRDKRLLMRNRIFHGILVRSDYIEEQLDQVFSRTALRKYVEPFSRCITCNGLLKPVEKKDILQRLPPLTAKYIEGYSICSDCGKIYWKGAHWNGLLSHLSKYVTGWEDR